MKCPYINPTIKECENCPFDDCIRPLGQDERDRQNQYYKDNKEIIRKRQKSRYHSKIEVSRKYYREYAREHYNTEKNTENCRKYRNAEKKKKYDRERYLRKKAEKERVI